MIHTRALLKTLGFMFLPSLSVLIILFFWFFSFSAFIAFITSATIVAGSIRLLMIALEFIVGYYVYTHYRDKYVTEEIISSKDTNIKTICDVTFNTNYSSSIRDAGERILDATNLPKNCKVDLKLSETANPNIYVIEKQIYND